jgi:hypothetical protein
MQKLILLLSVLTVSGLFLLQGCGKSAADLAGIGAECTVKADCNSDLICLTEFKGGYCGKVDCTLNSGCPDGSICITESGTNYCFMICTEKSECNENRTVANESNCSADVNKIEAGDDKVCVPPSSGV